MTDVHSVGDYPQSALDNVDEHVEAKKERPAGVIHE
jgi:hypothetical protein